MSRTENSLKNLRYAVFFKLVILLVNFIARKFFVIVLTKEYLGLNGTFANILSLLSIAELGIGTAITYSMYQPLADGDQGLIRSLLALYKKLYTIIGIVVAVLGTALLPFLPRIIRDLPDIPHINLIYLMFVFDSAISYCLVYKQSLISADQKQYIITSIQNKISILTTIAQCLFLVLTKNYIVYLSLKLLSTVVSNLLLAHKADQLYPYLKNTDVPPLPQSVQQEISKNVWALVAHRLGSVVVFETDNILIAYFIGSVSVGLYSNYLMITQSLTNAYALVFRSMTASIGNLCTSEDKTHALEIFWRVDLFARWLFGFSSVCLFVLLNHFITLWLGADYLFELPIVLLIAVNFYITGARQSVLTFRDAMGLYWYDRHKPILESIINLVVSILLAKPLGITGIFIGTFVSSVTTCTWIEPYVLFRHGFGSSSRKYFLRYVLNLLVTVLAGIATWWLCSLLPGTGLLNFIAKIGLCAIVPNLFYLTVYARTPEFHYYRTLLRGIVGRFLKRA